MRAKLKFGTFLELYCKNEDWFCLCRDCVVIINSGDNSRRLGMYSNDIETKFGMIDKIRYKIWIAKKKRKERKDEKERSEKELVEALREMQWRDTHD